MKKTILGALLFIISLIIMVPFSDWLYQKSVIQTKPFPTVCLEGWAHRGYVHTQQGFKENTIPSYLEAIRLGATGIELDVIYDTNLKDFIVSHDKLSDASHALRLSDALQQLPQINIWLDAKNLYQLWPWQAFSATEKLYNIVSSSHRLQSVLVESRSAWYLSHLSQYGVQTTLMIEPNPDKNPISLWLMIAISKIGFVMGDFQGISISYNRYRNEVSENFQATPAYLSTLNDETLLQSFVAQPQVKVFLTDNPNLYGEHCHK